MLFVGCAVECVETDAGGVCVDTYDTGYYYDSRVTGVTYENRNEDGAVIRTAVTGAGDDPGSFRFLESRAVSFSLGNTVLGQSSAQKRITPFDLAGIAGAFEPINAVSLGWKRRPAPAPQLPVPRDLLGVADGSRDAHAALELASMVLRADDGPAASVPERMGIITARASQKTTPTSG
jgi:hypothetical protein